MDILKLLRCSDGEEELGCDTHEKPSTLSSGLDRVSELGMDAASERLEERMPSRRELSSMDLIDNEEYRLLRMASWVDLDAESFKELPLIRDTSPPAVFYDLSHNVEESLPDIPVEADCLKATTSSANASEPPRSESTPNSSQELDFPGSTSARIKTEDVFTESAQSLSRTETLICRDPIAQHLDDSLFVAHLSQIFSDQECYRKLLGFRGARAQNAIDCFHGILNLDRRQRLTLDFRRQLVVASQRLATAAGVYPSAYELEPISTSDRDFRGGGGFGDIFEGRHKEQSVCVKIIRLHLATGGDQFMKQFTREAILWGQLSHRNVLPFQGFFYNHSRPCLVSSWMSNGHINQYLLNNPSVNRYLLIMDIISGLMYLHSWGIIHGDLKGANILVDDAGRALLADFGIASIFDTSIPHWTSHSEVASKGGSVRWQAPELFEANDDQDVYNTVQSDVYAWACVCYEVFTGKIPFYEILRDLAVSHKVRQDKLLKPSCPPSNSASWTTWGLTEDFWTLLCSCWSHNALERPTVAMLLLSTCRLVPEDTRSCDPRLESCTPKNLNDPKREMLALLEELRPLLPTADPKAKEENVEVSLRASSDTIVGNRIETPVTLQMKQLGNLPNPIVAANEPRRPRQMQKIWNKFRRAHERKTRGVQKRCFSSSLRGLRGGKDRSYHRWVPKVPSTLTRVAGTLGQVEDDGHLYFGWPLALTLQTPEVE